MTLKVWTYEMN